MVTHLVSSVNIYIYIYYCIVTEIKNTFSLHVLPSAVSNKEKSTGRL